MKKSIVMILIALLIAVSIIGCSDNSVENTSTEQRGTSEKDVSSDAAGAKGDRNSDTAGTEGERPTDVEGERPTDLEGDRASGGKGDRTGQTVNRDLTSAVPVEVTSLELQNISDEYRVLGKVYPNKEITIGSSASGIVDMISVGVGDYVEEGQVIYSLKDDELTLNTNQQLNNSLNTVNSTKIKYDIEQANYDNVSTLFDNGYASESELNKAKNDLASAQSTYYNAQQSYNNLKATVNFDLNETILTAPIAGIISSINVNEGEKSSTNDITIINRDYLIIETVVAGKVINDIQVNDEVRIDYDDESLVGYIEEISPVGINGTDSYLVKVKLEDNDSMNIGVNVDVYYAVNQSENQFVVPKKSVLTDSYGDYIYIEVDGRASKLYIEQGFTNNGYVQIMGELNVGDQVITNGQNMIVDGQLLDIK